ncbi:MAG: PaaI family thioesterase [Pseudomonadota bacterium]
MKETSMKKLVDKMEKLPYHRFIELKVASWGGGWSELTFPLSEATRNAFGAVHGGIYYTACDVAAFLATASLIPDDYFAVTSDINVSVMAAVLEGNLTVKSEVLKKGKRNCYTESKVLDQDGNLVVVARITKALLPLPRKNNRET